MIALKNVTFRYSGAEGDSLKNITLDVRSGECVVLTGKSGCGKTTVTRLINGLIPGFYAGNLSGTITVAGNDIAGYEPHMLSRIVGSVFQNPRTQFFNTDTDSELVFGMENCAVDYEEMHRRYHSTVHALGLESLCGRNIFALSGGEKQRIAFGSVHVLSPDVYVLDEPSANLDTEMVRQLKKVLSILKAQGKTILVAEHRLYYLKEAADRIIRMEDGGIVNEWTAGELSAMHPGEVEALGLRSFTEVMLDIPKDLPPRAGPVLEIEHLSAAYKGVGSVLTDVSFSVNTGEIAGIVGANGFGKSTIARTICGLHRETGGRILFDGKEVKHRKRSQLAYLVMQDPNYQLFGESVEGELAAGTAGKESSERESADLLQVLDLANVRTCHPLALSGGQKQRLCIALAALSPAKILIFDEPTSGLDHANMKNVADIIRFLAHKGKTILIITHDNELISTVCTRVIMLSK